MRPNQQALPNQLQNPQIGVPYVNARPLPQPSDNIHIDYNRFIHETFGGEGFVNSNLVPSEYVRQRLPFAGQQVPSDVQNDFELGELMFKFDFSGNLNAPEEIDLGKAVATAPYASVPAQFGYGNVFLEQVK